jgi:rhodanese-related sulfurtransferase
MLNVRTLVVAQAALLISVSVAAAQHTKDSLDKVMENIAQKKAILIDVREPSEWNDGHLEAAQHVPLSELKKAASDPAVQQKLEKSLPKQQIVYCHCKSGGRVLAAKGILSKLGYDLRPLAAGYDDLLEAGFAPAKDEE